MEVVGLVLMGVSILLILHNTLLCEQLGEDHSYILKKLERPSGEGPEGYIEGEVRDLIWLDGSLRKVRWSQTHYSWELIK